MAMSGDSVQYRPERPSRGQQAMASQLASYEEYGNGSRSHNVNGHPFKEEHWEDSSQNQSQTYPPSHRQQTWPFSHHPHASVNMMAATSSYDERTGMRSYRYNPATSNASNPTDMATDEGAYHQHQQYPSEGYPEYSYTNRNGGGGPGASAANTANGGGMDSQSLPQNSSPSNSERHRNSHNQHHRSNSNPQIDGVHRQHRRNDSGEQQNPQSVRQSSPDEHALNGGQSLPMSEWAGNSNNPYINRYHQSQQQQQQQQQAIAAYHAHHSTRDDATTTSNSSSTNNNSNNTHNSSYHNHPRSHHHLHQMHHPNNPQSMPPQFYGSMDVDPSSQNGNPNALPSSGYDDMSSQHAHQQQIALQYGYESQYASAAALSSQQQQQQTSFIPPSNYHSALTANRIKTDPTEQPPQGRSGLKVFASPSSSAQEDVISPTMSNTTATTAASTCTFGSGKDSRSNINSHYHPGEQFRGSTSDGSRMVVVHGGVVGMSDRKQMQSQAWYERFRELREYKNKHGNCMVPQKFEPNPSLGIWVNKQRMEYKLLQDGEKSSMTSERLSALQSIGFVWAKRKGQATWDAKYKQLQEYKGHHGDCLIPTKYSKDPALGRWVSTQREQYRLWKAGDDKSKMTVEKVRMLEEVGFVWRLQF